MPRRIRFRPPGVQTGRRIGPLGPFRGTLGLQWVLAPLLLGLLLGVAAWFFLRDSRPGPPWESALPLDTLAADSAVEVAEGLFVARMPDGQVFAVAEEPRCPLTLAHLLRFGPHVPGFGYIDCEQREFWFDGTPKDGEHPPLDLLPIRLHSGELFIDPTERIER